MLLQLYYVYNIYIRFTCISLPYLPMYVFIYRVSGPDLDGLRRDEVVKEVVRPEEEEGIRRSTARWR